ncbi:hypothetical protein F5888DRAFT_1870119 [Russula emetica]|nr:hypothetical protein F5888DRAFT_1808668 [Russula emetica]KAF8489648.1 hypothetical protein F5888DRAFT_1870119 [Russula emetica]
MRAHGLQSNSMLAQINGASPQQSPQITHPPLQPPIQPNKLPGLLSERDLIIDDRRINLWALHRAVFSRNGFESWPAIGVALGFPPVAGGDPSRPPRCGPIIAQRLQQLYGEVLHHFDQVYISSIVARLRTQASGQLPQPPQPQHQPPTEADYQALLASISSEASVMKTETMSILPRFSHTSGAELEAHCVPQHVITFMEQNREHLQRAAQDQNGFCAGLTSTKNAPLDNRTQVNHAPALQALARLQQFIPGHQQPQQLQRQGLAQGPGKPNMLQSAQLFNNGPHVPLSTPQVMNASNMQSMGAQIPGSNSSSGVQNQGGIVPVSMNPAAVNSVTSGSIVTQAASNMQVRRLNQEDLVAAKQWIEEKKRMAFSSVPNFDRMASFQSIPESDTQEYRRNLERLDQVLVNIEKYIHFAFAVLKKGEVVERLFKMMASTKRQLEELNKPNPRYVLELHTIRGMIQEADNMDKGLKAVFQKTQAMMAHNGVPSAPQPPPQPPASTSALFPQSAPQTMPPATAPVSRAPHPTPLQPAHRKKPSQAQAISTPTPLPIPVASTPTPQAATPNITAPSPQTPKSPKGKAAPKPKPPARRKALMKANSVKTPTPAHTVASTPTSSTHVDAKGGGKRAHDNVTYLL